MSIETPAPQVQDADTSVSDYGAMFEESEAQIASDAAATPAQAAPPRDDRPPADATAAPRAPAAEPTTETPAPAADDGVVDWKDEDGEKKFNVYEHFRDPEKRKILRDLIEKGHAFERVIPRREATATREAFKEIQAHAEEQGYSVTWDATAKKVRIAPKSGQVATPPASAEHAPPADVATLRAQRQALAQRVKAGDSDAIVEDYSLQGQIHDAEMAEIRAWKAQQERVVTTAATREFERNLNAFGKQYRTAKSGSFEGLSDDDYAGLVKGFADQSKTWEELRSKLDGYASRIDRAVQARIAQMTKAGSPAAQQRAPAPAAAPVMGGNPGPQGGGGGGSKTPVSTYDKDGFKKELDDFFGA